MNATTYYVDATNGNDNNSGTSPATAWQTIRKINSSVFLPGDFILFKRGEIWHSQLFYFTSSGNAGNRITIGAYGEGAKPIISGMTSVNLQWIVYSGNIWKTNEVLEHPQRLLKDGVELLRAENMNELNTNPEIFSWLYDETSKILYIYSTNPPGSSIISINTLIYTVFLDRNEHIIIRDIEIQGGYHLGLLVNGNYIDVINMTVGKYSLHAIQIGYYPSSHIKDRTGFADVSASPKVLHPHFKSIKRQSMCNKNKTIRQGRKVG